MKVSMAQINTVVGDVTGNLERILDGIAQASRAEADLIVFHELCLSGYPPKDLVERDSFIEANAAALARLVDVSREHPGLGIVVGLPEFSGKKGGKRVANVAVLVCDGKVVHRQVKTLLPTYDVFDEARYFEPATGVATVAFKGETLGISICEDSWNIPELVPDSPYQVDPIAELAAAGATLMVNISASPFVVGKDRFRFELLATHATRHKVPLVMVNQVGGNDDLVFDGNSMLVTAGGGLASLLPAFDEAFVTVDTSAASGESFPERDELDTIRRALVTGVHDYVSKCGFERGVVGLSGGVDSAVTLAIGVEALGAENVTAIAMPSPYSSDQSLNDARTLASNFGVALHVIGIDALMGSYDDALAPVFAGREKDVTEENIQARIRGNLLMAYANKFGALVFSTGNKSELAVGYCTLYGDMSGGIAVISDVPKTTVYRLARHFNAAGEVIPKSIIDREPSAELRPGQKDSDSLPPYETLDAILDLYVEDRLPASAIVERGFDDRDVAWTISAVRRNEYKRRQAAPGIKVTSKAFGAGRRFPIAARYDD